MQGITPAPGDGGWCEGILERCPRPGESTARPSFWTGGVVEQEGGPEIYLPAGRERRCGGEAAGGGQ